MLKQMPSTSASEPPRLAKAKSNASSFSMGIVDEDQPPPQLDRGPPVDEVEPPNNPSTVPPLCEPPAASPAYSDISDDGPAPQRSTAGVMPNPGVVRPPTNNAWLNATGMPTNVPTAQPPQAMDWATSSRRAAGGRMGNPPYDFTAVTAAAAMASGSTALNQFAAYGHQQRPLHVPPGNMGLPPGSENFIQSQLASIMASASGSKGKRYNFISTLPTI